MRVYKYKANEGKMEIHEALAVESFGFAKLKFFAEAIMRNAKAVATKLSTAAQHMTKQNTTNTGYVPFI